MKQPLTAGLRHSFQYRVPETKTVPHLYPEASEFQKMPVVFATGFMVGLFEWVCIQAIHPYLDWPREQSVGIEINVTHQAATPAGLTVTVQVELQKVDGRMLHFTIVADDGFDRISEGTHKRFIIDEPKFRAKLKAKADKATAEPPA